MQFYEASKGSETQSNSDEVEVFVKVPVVCINSQIVFPHSRTKMLCIAYSDEIDHYIENFDPILII
jgi:ribosomal protein S27E